MLLLEVINPNEIIYYLSVNIPYLLPYSLHQLFYPSNTHQFCNSTLQATNYILIMSQIHIGECISIFFFLHTRSPRVIIEKGKYVLRIALSLMSVLLYIKTKFYTTECICTQQNIKLQLNTYFTLKNLMASSYVGTGNVIQYS